MSTTTQTGTIAEQWVRHAGALAAWTDKRLVNRRDAYGHYIAVEARTDPDLTAFTDKSGLTLAKLERHFRGASTGDILGLHSTARDEADGAGEVPECWSRWGGIDIDRHDESTDPAATLRAALAWCERLETLGFRPLLIDSNGRGGYHLVVVFSVPVPTANAYRFLRWLTRDWQELGLAERPETYPKQPAIKAGGYGNWLRLPGRHHTRDHWSKVWGDGRWLEGREAIKAILGTAGDSAGLIPAEALAEPEPKARPKRPKGPRSNASRDAELARDALSKLGHLVDGYDEWIEIGQALTPLGSEGLSLWDEWSSQSTKYQEGDCDRKWRTFTPDGGRTLGTLFHHASRRGWEPPGAKVKSRARARAKPSTNGDGHGAGGNGDGHSPDKADGGLRFNLTDLGNAERLVAHHGHDLRYVHPWNKWLAWDGRRWAIDATGHVGRKAKDAVRQIYGEAQGVQNGKLREAIGEWALASESARAINAMIALARSELPADLDKLDRDPWSLNCPNGTLDLRAGSLRPHRREDLITKLCPVAFDPDAGCPIWTSTLDTIFASNRKLIGFVQRLCGLALTGTVTEQILPILHGSGANGKSTLLNVLLDLLGPDYAMKAPPDLLMVKRADAHPTERADLFGKRLVVAIETGEGARLNETLIKELTGSDKIRARRMREDFWEFHPTHKILLCTNHRPEVRGTDHAIWRRLRLIPFSVTIPDDQQDKDLPAKLTGELPGILAWCVRGCLSWQEIGLNPPDEVTEATREYRQEQDVLAAFLAEECVIVDQARAKAGQLYDRYRQWAERSGEHAESQRRFGRAMTERGFRRYANNGTWYAGIGLRPADGERDDDLSGKF